MTDRSIDEDLQEITDKTKDKASLSIKEILNTLSGKGRALLLIFLSLPFCQPIQIPGFSIPFGIVIAFLGLRMAFGKKLWLPKWILRKQIASTKIHKLSHLTLKTSKKLKFLIHPRLRWACEHPAMHLINGLVVVLLGLFLALPLPIPFSNMVAAWTLVLIGLGLLEDDGLFVLLGHVGFLATVAFFIAVLFFAEKLLLSAPFQKFLSDVFNFLGAT